MEWGNTLLDDYVLGADRRRAAAGLLPADRQRRRRPLRGPVLPGVLGRRAASPRTSRCSGARPASAIPGRTCSRRTWSTSAAAASCRCSGPGARTGSTCRCVRRGSAGVVLCGGSAGSLCWFAQRAERRSTRGRRGGSRGSGCCRGATRSTTTTSPAGATRSATRSPTGCRPGTASATARRCTSSGPSWPRSCPRARRRGRVYVVPRRDGDRGRAELPVRYLGARAVAGCGAAAGAAMTGA